MARPYRNDYVYHLNNSYDKSYDNGADFQSICDDIYVSSRNMIRRLWGYMNGRGRHVAWGLAIKGGQQVRRNLTQRRLLSFPHVLVVFWMLVMLWGERWIFASRVRSCDWDHWEDWVSLGPWESYELRTSVWGVWNDILTYSCYTTARRSNAASIDIRRRPPDHRPPLLPWPSLAHQPSHCRNNR